MDQSKYAEHSVKVKKKMWLVPVYVAFGVLFVFSLFLMLNSSWGVLLPIALFILLYIGKPHTKLEYEYTFITDELHIDKIYSGERRKKGVTVLMNDVESVVPTNVNTLPQQKKMPNVVFHDFSSKYPDAFTYTVTYYKEGKTNLLLIEPDEHILQVMKRVAPSKVSIAEVRKVSQ